MAFTKAASSSSSAQRGRVSRQLHRLRIKDKQKIPVRIVHVYNTHTGRHTYTFLVRRVCQWQLPRNVGSAEQVFSTHIHK